ncbi:unnamed protein product [Durusdinium trenchii]|uniref:Plant heme peroxidase family profile domain-containing protein n=1 Tax=Durusdinium trenchii TaxID=1381693 RepID=A0ABP0R9D9_9DINO
MTSSQYDAVVAAVRGKLESLPSTCTASDCPQADWAGCVLRMAGHDFMDFANGQGGSDACTDMEDPENAGLPACLASGEHGSSLQEVYQQFCTQVSLADFLVIAAEAVIASTRARAAGTASLDLRSIFRFGRRTASSCDFAVGRLPDPERGCTAVEETFVTRMGLTWTQAAALMGVHTLGRAQVQNSGYHGWWSDPENSRKFNNNYYVSLLAKGWLPELAINGNSAKNQWERSDIGRDTSVAGHEMMLNTDLCLAFSEGGGNGGPVRAHEHNCCAWLSARTIDGAVRNNGNEYCGGNVIRGIVQLEDRPTGPAAAAVLDFAADEAAWLRSFAGASPEYLSYAWMCEEEWKYQMPEVSVSGGFLAQRALPQPLPAWPAPEPLPQLEVVRGVEEQVDVTSMLVPPKVQVDPDDTPERTTPVLQPPNTRRKPAVPLPPKRGLIELLQPAVPHIRFDEWLRRWNGTFGYASDCTLAALRPLYSTRFFSESCSEKNKIAMDFLRLNHGDPIQYQIAVLEVDATDLMTKAARRDFQTYAKQVKEGEEDSQMEASAQDMGKEIQGIEAMTLMGLPVDSLLLDRYKDRVRDWAELAPDSVTFKNAMRVRKLKDNENDPKPVPHTFIYATRGSLPGEGRGVGLSERVPRDLRSSDAREARKDLFCLVKHEMSDEKLSQEPLLVWPAALHQRSKHFLGIANTTQTLLRPEFTDERRAEIRKLMIALRRDFPQLNRAAAWYQSLLERKPEENLEPYTHLSFLDNIPDEVYPSNQQFNIHFYEFLRNGYKPSMGSVDVRFDHGAGDRSLNVHTVKFVDGQTKVLIMLAIVGFCSELELTEADISTSPLAHVLSTFISIRCHFEFFENESHHFLHSLKLGYVTSEKLTPSPITIAADINAAIAVERRASRSSSKAALKDLLSRCVADYNKMTTVKKHRIDSSRRSLIYNLLLDSDISTLMKSGEEFEWGRVPFILEDHAVILWLNCPALGVISAGRMSFILNYISNVLSDFPLNSICFVVHPNRAGHTDGRSGGVSVVGRHEAEDEDMETKVKTKEDDDDAGSDDDSDDGKAKRGEHDDLVRRVRFNLENDLSLPERNLKVKNVTFVFEPESVYGKREGALQGLCVVSNNPKNIFRQTRGFKTGVVHSISMLQRSEMVKPDHVAGGTDFIQKTLQSFSVPSVGAIAMMDLHGYDGCPALSCVEDIASGKRSVCGTICLDHTGADMLQRVGNKIYESCRSQSLNLPGFPAFEPVLSALRSQNVVDRHKSYRVSAQQHDALYILEVYAKKWLATESTKERAQQVIEDHNKEFNPTEKTEEAEIKTEPPPAKRIKLETMTEQDISKMPKEADEVLANAEGRWFSFTVSAAETFFVLERKDLANHLAKLECVDTAVTLQSLICDLQDAGEVKLELSHHKEESGTFTSSKPLVFCLDEPPQDIISVSKKKGKKGAKGTQLTAKNFGSFLSVSKLKTASDTAWIDQGCTNDDGSFPGGPKASGSHHALPGRVAASESSSANGGGAAQVMKKPSKSAKRKANQNKDDQEEGESEPEPLGGHDDDQDDNGSDGDGGSRGDDHVPKDLKSSKSYKKPATASKAAAKRKPSTRSKKKAKD